MTEQTMTEKAIAFHTSVSRRNLLKYCAAIAVSGAAAGRAVAGGHNKVPTDDPQAVQLGYVEDATAAKHDKYAAGKSCANCLLYAGDDGKAYGPCPIFANREVAAAGWCSAYTPKP